VHLVTDSLGREIVLARTPRTIVSLVPSDTYSLVKLGVGDRVVGRTRYCVEPADVVAGIPEVGGTKNADVEAIVETFPDLVIANREENTRRDLERIAQAGIAVYVSFPKTLAEGLSHLSRLARMLGVADSGAVKDELRGHYHRLQEAESRRATLAPVATFFPIWMDPLMTIHKDTFISDALALAGAANAFADRPRLYPLAADLGRAPPADLPGRDTRYPRITEDELVAKNPELVLLPDEPYAFGADDEARFRKLCPGAAVVHVDGKDFSWYGARSLEAISRVAALVVSHRGGRTL
jgi:ABC-type Fe3+-hydroxamate transport system substrate-binding protein